MRLAFGRYIPYNSIIHRMDSRLKLIMVITLMICIFFPIGFTGMIIVTIFSIILFFASHLSLKMITRMIRPIIFVFIIMLIINIFMMPAIHEQILKTYSFIDIGKDKSIGYFIKIKRLYISEKASYKSLYMSWRILLMICFATVLTGTTQPLELTLGIEDVLSPLKLFKIPVYIFSTIISIALRMIPTLIDEAGRIMKAQASRGIDFKNGKISDKGKSIVSLIIPLLVSSFQKAEDLAYAMDSRGYNPYGKRTRFRQANINLIDCILFIFGIGFASFVICYGYIDVLNQFRVPRIELILGVLQ